MTDFENGPFNQDWKALVAQPTGEIDAELAARIVNHLVGRTHHLRGILKSSATAMGDLVQQLFGDVEFLRGKFAMDEPLPTTSFKEMMLEQLKDSPLSAIGIPPEALVGLCHIFLRENGENVVETVSSAASHIANKLVGSAATVARDAHTKGLKQSLSPGSRFAYLAALEWHIAEAPDTPFILPDYVCLGIDREERAGSLFDIGGEDLAGAYMPLSPSRMLVGRKGEGTFELSRFNEIAAPFCFATFVCNHSSGALKALAATIGSSALARIDEGLAEAASEIREGVDCPADIASAVLSVSPTAIDRPSAALRSEWLEKERAERLASLLGRLVAISSDRFDLRRLVLFDTPPHYVAAVNEVTGIDVAAALDDSRGGAFNVFFEDGGVHILLHPTTVELLLSDDVPSMTKGISIIMPQLAQIGTSALLQQVFEGREPVGEAHDRMMLASAVHCWIAYVVGLNSNFGPEAGAHHSVAHLPKMLVKLTDGLKALKCRFPSQDLADDLLNAAVLHVAEVLATAGEAAAAAITGAGNVVDLSSTLAELDLLRWFELLRSDLAGIWVPGTPYPQAEAFLVLNRHLERLLAMGGIFLWAQNERAHYWVLDWLAEPPPER